MFGIWGYIIATVGVIGLVGGAYWYVTSLQSKVEHLTTENNELNDANKTLSDSLKDVEKQQQIIVKVDAIGEQERALNRKLLEKQLKSIDDSRNKGEDKPVGKLLKDFLNSE